MKAKKKPEKRWGWTYVLEGFPTSITYNNRTLIELREVGAMDSQLQNVKRLVRALNRNEVKL